MELKIGNKTYSTVRLTGDFPIKFYKETGFDVFKLEKGFEEDLIQGYEMVLNLAYHLTGKQEETLEDFAKGFTPYDLMAVYGDILTCYVEVTRSDVESKVEKKSV